MKRKITKVALQLAVFLLAAGGFVSCTDHQADEDAVLKSQIGYTTNLAEALADSIDVHRTEITHLWQQLGAAQDDIDALEERMGDAEDDIAELKEWAKGIKSCKCNLDSALANYATKDYVNDAVKGLASIEYADNKVKVVADRLDSLIKNMPAAIDTTNLSYRIDTLATYTRNNIIILSNEIKEAAKTANDALLLAQQDSTRIDVIEKTMVTKEQVDTIINNWWETVKDSLVTKQELNDTLQVYDLISAREAADSVLQEQIDSLKDALEDLKDDIKNIIAKQITGIIVQQTYNPLIGTLNAPFGINSKIVAAYYGDAEFKTEFPTNDPTAYVDQKEAAFFTDEDLSGVSTFSVAQGDFLSNNEGGKVYITVNPTSNDYEGTEIKLTNSQGEENSGFTLSALTEAKDKVLNFGWTRTAGTILYETEATLSDIEAAKPKFSIRDLGEDLYSELNQSPSKINFTNIASQIYEYAKSFQAYGVSATWTDDSLGTTGTVYSDFGIAASAIHPLSYAALKDKAIKRSLVIPDIKKIVGDFEIKLDDANLDYKDIIQLIKTQYQTAISDDSLAQKVAEAINAQIDETNHQIKQQTEDNIDKIINNVQKYVNRANNIISKFTKVLTNPNHYLQPLILANPNPDTELGYVQVSEVKALPTELKITDGSNVLNLLPTTFTIDLLSPAYKRFVKVTNVYKFDRENMTTTASAKDGDADCQAAMDAANNGTRMNEVLDGENWGEKTGVWMNLTNGGDVTYEYEIVYSALDYAGRIANYKGYIVIVNE